MKLNLFNRDLIFAIMKLTLIIEGVYMNQQPLAHQMRPTNIDDIVGQQHLVGPNGIIRQMVQQQKLYSMILYGPPGVGKTSIASALAGTTQYKFRKLNAVTSTKKDIEQVILEGKMSGQVILLMDEIHRLNKAQQDILLPHLEDGHLIVIGATTANPYHAINPAIRSRMQIFQLEAIKPQDIIQRLRTIITQKNLDRDYPISDHILEYLAHACGGDIRAAINALELSLLSTTALTIDSIKPFLQFNHIHHDKDGDGHYDVLSAFQKSIRGSDVDASLHYLARLIEAEDLTSICRRLLVIAFEDIGLASPQAATRTLTAIEAAERLGFPEARIPLAQAVIELALSPKSNSAVIAIDHALQDLKTSGDLSIPKHLKDAHYQGAKDLGHGLDYQYPHNYTSGIANQQYLPNKLKHQRYYQPKHTSKSEQAFANYQAHIESINPKK